MFDNIQAFYRPGSIREAVQFLDNGCGQARYIAGGTDLAAKGDRSIHFLVDVTRLGLNYIHSKDHTYRIGGATTLAAIEESPEIHRLAGGILARAAVAKGSVQIRNMATVGGILASASPAADLAVALLALDARLLIADRHGEREVNPGDTGGALIVEVVIPTPGASNWSFQRMARMHGDVALVNVAAGLQLDSNGSCNWARIALGAVAPAPMRARRAEKLLTGRKLDRELLQHAGDEVATEISPIDDIRASAEYRRDMSRVLTKRALEECAAQAGVSL